MFDANQTVDDCYSGSKLKPFTIEWLRLQRALEDPFIKLMGSRPNSTTQTPNRPIDFILTFGITPESISTLPLNIPAQLDHIGMIFDLNMEQFFNSSFSEVMDTPSRILSIGNKKSVDTYIKFVSEQIENHNLLSKIEEIYSAIDLSPSSLTAAHVSLLNNIDDQLTNIMLAGERLCTKRTQQRQFWSPEQRRIARTFHIGGKNPLC
jgi:hypothetical protein